LFFDGFFRAFGFGTLGNSLGSYNISLGPGLVTIGILVPFNPFGVWTLAHSFRNLAVYFSESISLAYRFIRFVPGTKILILKGILGAWASVAFSRGSISGFSHWVSPYFSAREMDRYSRIYGGRIFTGGFL